MIRIKEVKDEMKKNKKLVGFDGSYMAVLLLSLLLCFGQAVIAMEPSNEEDLLKQGVAQYLVGRQMYYNAEGTFAEAKEALLAAKASFMHLPDGGEKSCWLAKDRFAPVPRTTPTPNTPITTLPTPFRARSTNW